MLTTTIESKHQAFQLKGSLFTLTVLQLINAERESFAQQLDDLLAQAPKFFLHAPIVIDLQNLNQDDTEINFKDIITELRQHGLVPVGVRGGNKAQHATAQKAGLALMANSKTTEETEAKAAIKTEPQPQAEPIVTRNTDPAPSDAAPKTRRTTKIITGHVRSGQQIYARDSDLIILGSVSEGAELLADGNIHIYGTLRGRALAGITGDTSTRIFCKNMQAELLSIASRYVVSESLAKHADKGPIQIFLESGRLTVQPL